MEGTTHGVVVGGRAIVVMSEKHLQRKYNEHHQDLRDRCLIAAAGAVALGFAAPAANAAVFPNNPVNVTRCSPAPQHPPRNA